MLGAFAAWDCGLFEYDGLVNAVQMNAVISQARH